MVAGPVCESGCGGAISMVVIVLGLLGLLVLGAVVCTALAVSATLQRTTQLAAPLSRALGLLAALTGWPLFAVVIVGAARNGAVESLLLVLPAMIGSVVWWRSARRQLRESVTAR